MRTKVLTLLATAIVGIGVLPSLASAGTPEAVTPQKAEAAFESLPSAEQARVKSDCPASYVCFWSGKTFGTAECQAGLNCFSAFHGYEVGEHKLENINPQSMYNHTGERTATIRSSAPLTPFVPIYPGETYQWGSRYNDEFWIS